MELNTQSQVIKLHCPQCFKLYSVNPAQIQSARPEFRCPVCQAHFYFTMEMLPPSREIIGMRMEPEVATAASPHAEIPQAPAPEPKEERPFQPALGQTQFEEKPQKARPRISNVPNFPSASSELKLLWEHVLADYENRDVHERFVTLGDQEDHLAYCAARYKVLLEASPSDEIARDMQARIQQLIEARWALPPKAAQKESAPARRFSLIHFLFFVSGIVVAIGLVVPAQRNLVGVGASMIFLCLALRTYRDRIIG